MEPQATLKSPTDPQPMEQLSLLALRKVSSAIPMTRHQSFAIPVVKNGRLKVCFMYCPAGPSPKGREILAPEYLETVDAVTGRLDDFITVTPRSLGQTGDINDVIGYVPMPAGMTPDEYMERRSRMLASMDRLVKPFFAGRGELDEDQRRAASEFRALWASLSEAALAPYYESVGKPWFDWVKRVSP